MATLEATQRTQSGRNRFRAGLLAVGVIIAIGAAALIVAPYAGNLFQIQTIVPTTPSGSVPIGVYLDGRLAAQGTVFIQ